MPLTLIGVALTSDISRAILANREVTNATDAVAMAAATAYNEGRSSDQLDETEATSRAEKMLSVVNRNGMVRDSYEAEIEDLEFSEDGRTVTVTVSYTVPEFILIGAIMNWAGGGNEKPGLNGTVVRAASVCLPDAPPTEAGCAYPLD
jgi:Flp pilus assembly protein TadG